MNGRIIIKYYKFIIYIDYEKEFTLTLFRESITTVYVTIIQFIPCNTIIVTYIAEPEVIESSYRRLSKKYHPDVNKKENANEEMMLINKAYSVLRDPALRKQYFLRWIEKNREYQLAYELLSETYKENITRKDFVKWQKKVSEIFE